MCLMLFVRESLRVVEGRCEAALCFSYRAYERAEAVTVGDGANTSICNLYWDLLHRAAVPTQLQSV